MYKLFKDKERWSTVVLANTETHAALTIGKITPVLLEILREEDTKFEPAEEWKHEITDSSAAKIQKLAMRMKKPIRDQSKKVVAPKKDNKHIDAMDVLLGLASYN